MKYKDFLNHLQQLKENGWIGYMLDDKDRIRLRIKDNPDVFCPITAVTKHITGEIYPVGNFRSAAKRIGLSLTTSENIQEAADFKLDTQDTPTCIKIRKSILKLFEIDNKYL